MSWTIPPPIDSGWTCPRCKGRMVMRMRRTDAHAFYGCFDYPKCRGTRDLDGVANYGHPDPHGNMDHPADDIYALDNGGWGS